MRDVMCAICCRREPARGNACDPCRAAVRELLNDLPRKMALLPLMLVPGQSPPGEKVATTRVGSPTSTRLDALSLVGPGSVSVPAGLHPLVRHWSTRREVTVHAKIGAGAVDTHTFTIVEWHRELVTDPDTGQPVLVGDDDQVGVIPPAEWLDQATRGWRAVFGHTRPPVAYVKQSDGPRPPRDPIRWVMDHGTPQQVAAMFAVQQLQQQYRQGVTDLTVGHEPGHAGRRPAGRREQDPVADAWEIRFGEQGITHDAATNIKYLRGWWDTACEHDGIDVARFAAELRSLSAELTRVLGEKPDDQWLGRCPATITDKQTGTGEPCGAGLWQDPHASVVECPRCHASWGPQTINLMHLAAEIRRVWPLDRRRRYNADEIDALTPPPCGDCGQPVKVSWQDVTATGDHRRWWRPVRTHCPAGCTRGSVL
jgi:hypothetical protein